MPRPMKDSGVEWLGDIPAHWKLGRIGQLYTERKEKVSDVDYPPLSVTMKGILPQLSTAAKSDAHDDRKLVRKGDFAINSRSDRRGSCGISSYDGSVSLINIILTPREEMNPVYYDWLFHSTMFADEFYKWGHGIVDDLWTTNWQDMKKIFVPLPPLEEQQHIATFLDGKCARIDSVIEKTRASIEEYKKLKQSLITRAVTKGIRPARPMKDSGVEWIGDIPADWEVIKLKYLFSIIGGNGFPDILQGETYGDYPFCKVSDINGEADYVDTASNWVSQAVVDGNRFNVIPIGSIIMAKIGAALTKNHRKINKVKCCIDNNTQALVPKRNDDLRYLFHLSKCIDMSWFDNNSTVPSVNNPKLLNFYVPVPPLEEQKEIAQYLDEKTAAIDLVVGKKNQLVTELERLKKSLIFEYVTGKKAVAI